MESSIQGSLHHQTLIHFPTIINNEFLVEKNYINKLKIII